MIKKFVREGVTKRDKLYDSYMNSFNAGGFIFEDVYTTTDRDMEQPFLDMLSNIYGMGIYRSILVGYRHVPYSEEIIQEEEFGKLSDRDIKKFGSSTFALTKPLDVKILECIWIKTPVTLGKFDENYVKPKTKNRKKGKRKIEDIPKRETKYKLKKPKKAAEIMNTLKILEELDGEFFIIPEVREFLQSQLKKQDMSNIEEIRSNKNTLFINDKNNEPKRSYLFVPLLKDNAYYEDGAGNKRYPYMSECYHYHKTRADQIKFHVKEIKKNSCVLVDSYFTVGRPKDAKTEIFVIKQYGFFYNPFSFLDDIVAERLFKRLANNPVLSADTYETLVETYQHYKDNVDIRVEFGNAIPPIEIVESSVKALKVTKPDSILENLAVEPEDIDLDEDFGGEYVVNDPEEEARERAIRHSKGYSTIDDLTIESIILGHNGERCFGYYNHLIEYYLRVFITSGASTKKSKSINLDTKDIPKPLQMIATINQNSDLFMANNLNNPFDAFLMLAYKKHLYFTPKEKHKSTDYVNPKERYRDYETEYGIIDSITVKSEETCGLVAGLIPYLRNAKRFNFRDKARRMEKM